MMLRWIAPFYSTAMLALAVASPANAAEMPRYSELPIGRVTAPKDTPSAPRSVRSGESAPGFHLMYPYPGALGVSSSSSPSVPERAGDATCFASMGAGLLDWNHLAWKVPLYSRKPQVVLVHSERVVENGGVTSLESVDAWVDEKTRGIRVAARGTLPLRQIATGPGGIRVFAARDEREDGRRFVQFVVVHPKDAPVSALSARMITPSIGSAPSVCGHHRVAVPVTRDGDAAVVQLTAVLPDLPPGEPSSARPLPPPPAIPGHSWKDVRARRIRAQFSVSQTSRDPEPVLGMSLAWAGVEELLRVRNEPRPSPPVLAQTRGTSEATK